VNIVSDKGSSLAECRCRGKGTEFN